MFALFAFGGFATIKAEQIPEGIMPKRQVAGTGVSTTVTADTTTIDSTTVTSATPSSTDNPSTTDDPTTTDTPISATPTTSDTVASTTAPSPTSDTTTPTSDTSITEPSSTTAAPTSDSTSATSATDDSTTDAPSSTDSPSPSSQAPSSTTEVPLTTTDSAGSTVTSSVPSVIVQSSAESSTEIPTTIAVTTTNSDGSTITSRIATSTLAPASSRQTASGIVRTETGKSSNLVVVGSSTINRSTLKSATTITSALLAEETIPSTYTSYWTSDGSVYSSVVTTQRVISSTTGFATATISPSLRNGGGDGSNLSTSTKKVIGGVVGGIGGAILIGGIALVCWRLWGNKKREQIPQDDFMDSRDDSISREKRRSSTPFPDSYANPNGPVNTASNF